LKKTIFNLFSLIVILILFSLGTWQLYRLQWKENIIKNISESSKLEPALLTINNIQEFKKIKTKGQLLEQNYFLYQLNDKGKYGFNLISILKTESSDFFLIKRGWLPSIEKKYEKNIIGNQPIEIEGFINLIKTKGAFVPDNDSNERFFYYLDIKKLSNTLNIKIHPYLILQSVPDEYLPNLKNINNIKIPNNHLQYALTWYVLAICILIAFWILKKRYK